MKEHAMTEHSMTELATASIYIVEDHSLVREILCEVIEMMPGFQLSGKAGSAEEALADLPDGAPDLVLVDMSLPGMSGTDFIAACRERWPALHCVAHSAHMERTYAEQALAAGARGYVVKGRPDELEGAIRQVLGGAVYLSPLL